MCQNIFWYILPIRPRHSKWENCGSESGMWVTARWEIFLAINWNAMNFNAIYFYFDFSSKRRLSFPWMSNLRCRVRCLCRTIINNNHSHFTFTRNQCCGTVWWTDEGISLLGMNMRRALTPWFLQCHSWIHHRRRRGWDTPCVIAAYA